jgi:nitroimidazol reductase NimA-like FMN-containing flavoprotein (pyridoxamine 5'-phosphate oxidase superfamily)
MVDRSKDDGIGQPTSERVTLRRGASRAAYGLDVVHAILDAGLVAHVGVPTESGPIVLPMAYGRTDDTLYLHGSAANAMLRAARSTEICATVTIVDGLVFARSPFHNSMNYRSVVVRGLARPVDDPAEHLEALRLISNHVVDNWEHGRAPNPVEIRKTMAIAVPLDESSAKVRVGDPLDEPEDLDGPHWAGTVPLRYSWDRPIPAADLGAGIETPPPIVAAFGEP